MPENTPLQDLYNEYNPKLNLAKTYNEFAATMQDASSRKDFFDEYNSKLNLAKDFNEFETSLNLKKKGSTTPTTTTSNEPAKTPQLGYGSEQEALSASTSPYQSPSPLKSGVKTVPPTKENPLGVHPDNLKVKNTGKSIEIPEYNFDVAVKKSEEENKAAKEESIKNNSITQTPFQ